MVNWLKLKEVKLTDTQIRKLMEMYNKFEDLYAAEHFKMFNNELKKKLDQAYKIDIDEIVYENSRRKIRILTPKDREYPKELKQLVDYPLFLYIKGKKIEKKGRKRRNIAVVGTRKMSKYGKGACEKIVKELLEYDITLVSGLAEGIDTLALTTSLDKEGKTVAVVGTGLDVVFPQDNKYLWEKISIEGTIISEYPLGTPGSKWTFPKRNRIIAGISDGILIGESFKSGGSLITAELGFLLNKEIFAIPGFINYPSFEGCNNLIKENRAKLVTCAEDIAKEFLWDIKDTTNKVDKLENDELLVYETIIEEMSVDEIWANVYEILQIDVKNVLSILMKLRIKGLITETGNGKYIRVI